MLLGDDHPQERHALGLVQSDGIDVLLVRLLQLIKGWPRCTNLQMYHPSQSDRFRLMKEGTRVGEEPASSSQFINHQITGILSFAQFSSSLVRLIEYHSVHQAAGLCSAHFDLEIQAWLL